ncbi:MAG: hypothetical protein AAB890_02255 [Patescibacteria group bacterium]
MKKTQRRKIKKVTLPFKKMTDKEKDEVISIKNEIKELKTSLYKKVDLEKLEMLELRVVRIEKHFKLIT